MAHDDMRSRIVCGHGWHVVTSNMYQFVNSYELVLIYVVSYIYIYYICMYSYYSVKA
jgi:hypothetical protein